MVSVSLGNMLIAGEQMCVLGTVLDPLHDDVGQVRQDEPTNSLLMHRNMINYCGSFTKAVLVNNSQPSYVH